MSATFEVAAAGEEESDVVLLREKAWFPEGFDSPVALVRVGADWDGEDFQGGVNLVPAGPGEAETVRFFDAHGRRGLAARARAVADPVRRRGALWEGSAANASRANARMKRVHNLEDEPVDDRSAERRNWGTP